MTTNKELRKLIRSTKVKEVYIFVAITESYFKVSKSELLYQTKDSTNSTWDIQLDDGELLIDKPVF